MSDDMLEVLDANIVVLLEEPLTQTVNTSTLFEGNKLARLMRKPVSISQAINIDPNSGAATGAYQFESIRSQKTISLSPVRLEVHDRSGERDLQRASLPETTIALLDTLGIERIKTLGANWLAAFELESTTAVEEIGKKLLQRNLEFLPQNFSAIGGSARLFLTDPLGVIYTLSFDPRPLNAQTYEVGLTCNAEVTNPETISISMLENVFQQCFHLLFKVKESLFPTL